MMELIDLEEAYLNASNAKDTAAMKVLAAEIRRVKGPQGLEKADDVIKSFAGGYGSTLGGLVAGGAARNLLGPGANPLNLPGKAPTPSEMAIKGVHDLVNAKPKTKEGEYAERVGAGASFGPGGVTAAVAGGAGGALSQFVKDQGYNDPVSQLAAWMAPSAVMSLGKALRPGVAQRDSRTILRGFEDYEQNQMAEAMREAQKRGVELMPWQAAPEGSTLNEAGRSLAVRPGAEEIQQGLRGQTRQGDQAWIKEQAGPSFEAIRDRPVTPRLAERLTRSVGGVVGQRRLNPRSPDTAAVGRAAEMFGERLPGDQNAFLNQLVQEVRAAPAGQAQRDALARLMQAQSGQLPAPPVFSPVARNVGEVISGKQAVSPRNTTFASSGQGTLFDVRKAIDDRMKAVPGYTEAMQDYEKTAETAEIVARDQKLKGRHVAPEPSTEGRTSPGVTVPYAIATNPMWALIPPLRRKAERAIMTKLDQAFADRDFGAMQKLAAEHPQWEAFVNVVMQRLRAEENLPAGSIGGMVDIAKRYLPGSKE